MADHRGSPLGWQIITLAGYQVYITVEMIQPEVAAQPMQGAKIVYSEAKADALYKAFLKQQAKPKLTTLGSPEFRFFAKG